MITKLSPNKKSRRGTKITHIVLHCPEGSYAGTIDWFMQSRSNASAHYVVSKKGEVTQMVKDEDEAWHVLDANPFCLGIEMEDGFYTRLGQGKTELTRTCKNDPGWCTDIQLKTVAGICKDLMVKFNIPKENIIGHNNPFLKQYRNNHTDPEKYFPWTKFRALLDA